MTTDLLTRLDVRPILADGGEPFDLILETAARIPPGGELELVAPFDPVPLVPHLRLRGFRRGVVAEGHDGVVTRWRRTGVTAQTSVAEAAASGPAAAAVLAVSILSFTFLRAWRGWLELRRHELAQASSPDKPAQEDVGVRIELAGVKERLKKLEAIASGIDL